MKGLSFLLLATIFSTTPLSQNLEKLKTHVLFVLFSMAVSGIRVGSSGLNGVEH